MADAIELVLHHNAITKETIERIHEAGMEAEAWTVNDEATMIRQGPRLASRRLAEDPRVAPQDC